MTKLPEMVSYFNEQINISILLPEQWTVQVLNQFQFRIFGLPESGFEEHFEEYRSTMSYLLTEPENHASGWFEGLITESSQEMLQDYNEYQLISEAHCKISTQPAYVRNYEWTEENTGLQILQLQSLIYNNSSSFYLINAAILKPLEDKYMPIFNAILESTRIIPMGSSFLN